MKKSGLSLMNLVFFIPAIILSVLVWNDYNGYMTNIDDHLPSLDGLYFLDEGRKAVGLSDERGGTRYRVHLFDAAAGTIIEETKVRSNIHGPLDAASYQQGGVIIPTYDDSLGLQLNFFRPSGEVDELAQGTLQVPGYLSSGVYSWRGRLIITGETPDSALYLAQVKEGKLDTVHLNSPDLLHARPVRLMEVHGSFDNDQPLPIFEVDLKDDRTVYISGILDEKNQPALLMQTEEETSFDARDKAGARFARHFGIDNTKLVKADTRYPGQAHFYNAAEEKWGGAVPTPKPVYQAKVFLLNDREVLVAGSSAEDELNGSILGYVFNEKNGGFTDVTGLVGQLAYEDLRNAKMRFFKELDSDMLYFSMEQKSAGAFNVKNRTAQVVTTEQAKRWLLLDGEDRISLRSFWNYVRQGDALVVNWAVWLVLPVLSYIGLAVLVRILRSKQSRQIAEGNILPGTILRMEETGVYVNEQPQVRFTVRFEDEGRMKEVAIKKVISFLNEVKVGDPVVISYNQQKNSAVFVTAEDLPKQKEPEMIRDAVLRRIEVCGNVNRSKVLQLHFTAGGSDYAVPVVQPPGFEYRVGERANLALVQGMARIHSYGNDVRLEASGQISAQGEVICIEEFPVTIGNRQLMMLEVMVSEGTERIRKVNSLFMPKGFPVKAGVVIPIIIRKEDYAKELRLQKGKQGAAKVTTVRFDGTLGERPLAQITAEREGVSYRIHQSIEPIYGVEAGDELWIAYDENSREAVILNYSSL